MSEQMPVGVGRFGRVVAARLEPGMDVIEGLLAMVFLRELISMATSMVESIAFPIFSLMIQKGNMAIMSDCSVRLWEKRKDRRCIPLS